MELLAGTHLGERGDKGSIFYKSPVDCAGWLGLRGLEEGQKRAIPWPHQVCSAEEDPGRWEERNGLCRLGLHSPDSQGSRPSC